MRPKKLGELMNISNDLATLNHQRYIDWDENFSLENTKPAIQAFKGDVYLGLQVETFTLQDLDFAQEHLRILSGLHGILRPLDLIKPYRLEMGTKLPVNGKKNLYNFWGKEVTERINEELEKTKASCLLNLASDEYFGVIDVEKLAKPVLKISFKEYKNGQYKVLSFFAKKARGLMAAYIVKNRITEPEYLKEFSEEEYIFNTELSNTKEWVFTRNREK